MVTLTAQDIMELFQKNTIELSKIEELVVERFTEKELKLATAESCTGGLISERITRVSGASAMFDCGVCSYANEIKEKVLGVRHDTLQILGAVSAETAMQMAEGVKKLSGADIAVSTTGIAGPTGGTPSARRASRVPREAPRRSPSDWYISAYAPTRAPMRYSFCSARRTPATASARWQAPRRCFPHSRRRSSSEQIGCFVNPLRADGSRFRQQ